MRSILSVKFLYKKQENLATENTHRPGVPSGEKKEILKALLKKLCELCGESSSGLSGLGYLGLKTTQETHSYNWTFDKVKDCQKGGTA